MSTELKRAIAGLAEARERARKLAGERDALLVGHRKLSRELGEALATRDRYQNVLFKKLIREAAQGSLEQYGGKRVLALHVEKQLRVEEEGDRFSVVVIDEQGKVRRCVGVDDIVKAMRIDDDFAKAFRPKEEPGKKLAGNPWEGPPESWDITQQSRLLKLNKGLAYRYMREVGIDPRTVGAPNA